MISIHYHNVHFYDLLHCFVDYDHCEEGEDNIDFLVVHNQRVNDPGEQIAVDRMIDVVEGASDCTIDYWMIGVERVSDCTAVARRFAPVLVIAADMVFDCMIVDKKVVVDCTIVGCRVAADMMAEYMIVEMGVGCKLVPWGEDIRDNM